MDIRHLTKDYDLTILLPALNEEESIGKIIDEINYELKNSEINYCILVSDNGSSDNTLKICKDKNVLINEVEKKGYGANLINAIKKVNSKFLIFFDCDGSYPPSEIQNMYNLILNKNLDMVYGNRLVHQEKNSMPLLHRYLGTPVLSFFIRIFFKNNVKDCNSGMRILKVKSFENINFYCSGMEFASEIFIKCSFNNLGIEETNIKFRKDFRSNLPHLSRWKDGWRHLRYIMSNAPDNYLKSVFALVFLNYFIIFLLSFYNVENNFPRYHTIFALLALNQFLKSLFLGIISLRIHLHETENLKSIIINKLFILKKTNIFMKIFVFSFLIVFVELLFVSLRWYENSFSSLNEISTMIRILIYSAIGSFSMYFDLQVQSRERE